MDIKRPVLLLLLVIVLAACIAVVLFPPGTQDSNTSRALSAVEIRDYQGQKLDSVTDFRENSIKGPQQVNISTYQLRIDGLVDHPLTMNYSEVLTYPHFQKVVTLHCVEGWDATILWDGVKVADLIDAAGIRPGANTVIFYAYDGYSTSLPLDYIQNNSLLLASGMNNVTLPVDRGYPFALVAEDKWGYKWIKWVTRIELSNDPGYRGYWEQRGYSLGGNLSGSFFG
jgi:DMSO/TMAO reductase YedYZ molybdopterin-dependent catalytic subunit